MILLLLLSLLACDNSTEAKRAKKLRNTRNIKLGVICNNMAEDDMLYSGVKLAVDEVNKSLPQGKTISIVVKEDNMSVNDGITNASLLAEDLEVLGVIGHVNSYISIPASSIYEYNGILMMTPASTAQELTENGYKYIFRALPSDVSLSHEMADYFVKANLKKVNICYISNSYGLSFANAFEARAGSLGLDIVDRVSFDVGDLREFNRIIKRWENYDYDSIIFIGYDAEGINFYKVLYERGIKVPVISGEAMVYPALLKADKRYIDGKIFPCIYYEDEANPIKKAFIEKFKEKYGSDPERIAAIGYDAVHLIAKAIKEGKSYVPRDISASLKKIKDYPGVVETYNFDAKGEFITRQTLGMQKIEDGQFKYMGQY